MSIAVDIVELPAVGFWFKLLVLICDDVGWAIDVEFGDCVLLIFVVGPEVEVRISEVFNSLISRDGLWIVEVSDVDVPEIDFWMEFSEWLWEESPVLEGGWCSSTSGSRSYYKLKRIVNGRT